MDRLQPDTGRSYWVREQDAEGKVVDLGEKLGQIVTEVEIALPISHNTLIIVEEYVK